MKRLTTNAGRNIAITETTADAWSDQMPTNVAGRFPVSEGVGTIDGAVFCFWLGNESPESVEVEQAVAEFAADQDVVGLRFIRGFPDKVHPAVAAALAEAQDIPEDPLRPA